MPRQIERGDPHILRGAVAQMATWLASAFTLKPAAEGGAHDRQRAMMMRNPVNPAQVTPRPQRLAVGASMEFAGYTRTPQKITLAPSVRQADMPPPQLVANPYPIGNAPAILPARTRLPVT